MIYSYTQVSQYLRADRSRCRAPWAEKDRNALLCQLNSYLGQKEGAA